METESLLDELVEIQKDSIEIPQTSHYVDNKKFLAALIDYKTSIDAAKEKNEQELITDDEMQRRLGVSRTTLYNWRKDGTIPYLRIGKKLFYRWKEIINKLG